MKAVIHPNANDFLNERPEEKSSTGLKQAH